MAEDFPWFSGLKYEIFLEILYRVAYFVTKGSYKSMPTRGPLPFKPGPSASS